MKTAIRSCLKFPPIESVLVKACPFFTYPGVIEKLLPTNKQYKPGKPRTALREGIWYELYLNDMVDWGIYFPFKQRAIKMLSDYTQPGFTVIDIGANNGRMAFECLKKVGKNGRVIAFEPDPRNFSKLKKNVSLNSFSNINLENLALGSSEGQVGWQRAPEDNCGVSRIDNSGSEKVEVTTLDAYVTRNGVKKIDLIKLDAEGYEMEVFNGARNTLKRDLPILFIQLSNEYLKKNNSSAKELIQVLEDLGYSISRCEIPRKISSTSDFTSPDSIDYCGGKIHYDIVCTSMCSVNTGKKTF